MGEKPRLSLIILDAFFRLDFSTPKYVPVSNALFFWGGGGILAWAEPF